MARLIDADALLEQLKELLCRDDYDKENLIDYFYDIAIEIEKAPTFSQWLSEQWICAEERLPDRDDYQIMVLDSKDNYMRFGYKGWLYRSPNGELRMPARHGRGMAVTHWFPLQPPQKK